ncbi:DUF2513 domain-containing protein [Paenibacillus oenotherae]|uniref:DUF2513 domain-containing protein n=1 Tax=Paenibacillus oenotherae TaxID=1435645 RepID=A0ABS7D9W2_9BACL|nr:DUF2513 domain-containing protein [Paenibacillus oenotherae]
MKLNPDCIRAILLTVEDESGYDRESDFYIPLSKPRLTDFSYEEVFYHIDQCRMSGLVTRVRKTMNPSYHVEDLTPTGHAFLADIRSDTNWNKTKEIAKNVGSFSLDALTKIAVGVVTAAINKNF